MFLYFWYREDTSHENFVLGEREGGVEGQE